MFIKHIKYLRCPKTAEELSLVNGKIDSSQVVTNGTLESIISKNCYPIVNGIPRFVEKTNYADNFGLQWNIHNRTQYDSTSNVPMTKKRFFEETKWAKKLTGDVILEAGCGSGRFTEHAASTNAMVCSFDYSNAVDANYLSNGKNENVLIVQANIYNMPFPVDFFDKVYCFGVLQHTPDVKKSFFSLIKYLKPGGKLATDVYEKRWHTFLTKTKYWVRPFTIGMNPEKLYKSIEKYVNMMWPICSLIRKIPIVGPSINWRLLVADYSREGVTGKKLKEWAYLDTFDMLSPKYDIPQTLQTFQKWHEDANLNDLEVHYGYNGIEARATKFKDQNVL